MVIWSVLIHSYFAQVQLLHDQMLLFIQFLYGAEVHWVTLGVSVCEHFCMFYTCPCWFLQFPHTFSKHAVDELVMLKCEGVCAGGSHPIHCVLPTQTGSRSTLLTRIKCLLELNKKFPLLCEALN